MLDRKSLGILVAGLLLSLAGPVRAQVVPGSGQELTELSDNFEDPNWTFTLNLPKASVNIDKVDRQPSGFAANQMWFESTYRGTPDFVKRVETPAGGLPGSQGAMALQTLYSGVPGTLSNKFQQDDLIANVSTKLGFMIPAAWTPSYVVRVYLPPFESWEQRVGSTFGFRADCQTIIDKPTKMGRFFRTGGTSREMEQYWPGFFIQFNGKNHPQHQNQNSATILIRSGTRGEDVPGPLITRPGWWTLGMTITPDGQVHYYGHEGVANLTHRDHLYSNFPYGYKCLQTSTYFFNIVNQDDGRSWSTRWIIDDPKTFVATRPYSPQAVAAKVAAQPISQSRPATPATAAPAAAAPAAIPPAIPTAIPAPATPLPAIQTPASPLPAIKSAPMNLPSVPSGSAAEATNTEKATTNGLPPLQGAVTTITTKGMPPLNAAPVAVARTKPPVVADAARPASTPSLPPLLNTPAQVAPIPAKPEKSGETSAAVAPPALLPDDSMNESAPLTSPVISTPAPAPVSPPQDDAPVLPPLTPTTESAPTPQSPKSEEPPPPLLPPQLPPVEAPPKAPATETPAPPPMPPAPPVSE